MVLVMPLLVIPLLHRQPQSVTDVRTEQLSHELAQRFAEKCFTPLELTHFKDVFRTLADEQDGIRYWKEETLCRFLVVPDALGPGPVIYQMATYLGAFPFPSLAPCILTKEAMLVAVVIMTERYGKVLKKGKADRNKLLFRSLAVFDRMSSVQEQPDTTVLEGAVKEEISKAENEVEKGRSHVPGFSVDAPGDDEEDEDEGDLALAALDSMDAIELFKHDQRGDRKIHHSQIPIDNFRRLLMLLLVIAPLESQDNLSRFGEGLTETRLEGLRRVADSILWSFTPEENAGISYHAFNTIIPTSLPYLFDPLNPLFEHFLFSKNINLSRRKPSTSTSTSPPPLPSPPLEPLLPPESEILSPPLLSQLSFFLPGSTLFHRLRLLYSGGTAGFSLGAFSQKVLNWHAPSILLVTGTRLPPHPAHSRHRAFADTLPPKRFPDSPPGNSTTNRVLYGAYLPLPWNPTPKAPLTHPATLLFQLEPLHDVFPARPLATDHATLAKSGIAFGSPLPAKPVAGRPAHTPLGPVSLALNDALEYGVFTHDGAGGGAFRGSKVRTASWQDRFEIESLEVWGCGGDAEAERQRKAWAWEEREAAARRGVTLGRDGEADRALLAMAGLLASENHGASGGSMG